MDYPKIGDTRDGPGGRCVAFEKLDGTNLGWEWLRGLGFVDQTTRRLSFDAGHPVFGEAVAIFNSRFAAPLDEILSTHSSFESSQHVKVFTEFLGPSSCAGLHVPEEEKALYIIDVWTDDRGFLGPDEFLAVFADSDLPLARVVYRGKFTGKLTDDVKKGRLGVVEGVVVKGGETGNVWRCKVKTQAWLDALEAAFREGTWTDAAGVTRSIKEEIGG